MTARSLAWRRRGADAAVVGWCAACKCLAAEPVLTHLAAVLRTSLLQNVSSCDGGGGQVRPELRTRAVPDRAPADPAFFSSMGRVRTKTTKRAARVLIERY
jgi:hypothetical protein